MKQRENRMARNAICAALIGASCAAAAQSLPGTQVTTRVEGGKLTYDIDFDGRKVISNAQLGLVTDKWDMTKGLTLDSIVEGDSLTIDYTLRKIKQSAINKRAAHRTVWVSGADKQPLGIEFVIESDAVAFRYLLPKRSETGSARVMRETTEFRFPDGTTTFLTPQSTPMIGWKRTKPSYEEEYGMDRPMNERSKFGCGYTFPGLFHIGGPKEDEKAPDTWALVSETGVTSLYCGSRLSDYADGAYRVAYPMAEENNGNGTAEPGIALPGATPWRTISVGATAGDAALSTITWDVVEPQYESAHKYKHGKGTWSWILWQDGSINEADQRTFIDLAHSMGYSYVLVDNWWDTNIGREGMARLSKYGKDRGVGLVVWYSSSGYWNDIVQGPINHMDRSIVRKAEMRWLKSIGAKGIKVDFFGGDKQETMRLYEEILSDADDAGLFVIFHGATLPRGWERMYPNFVGAEAVLASENLIFDQHFCDTEAECAALHPFIRNAVACMEYGGSFMNIRMSRDNASGNKRNTTDVFSIATAVLFQNPMQFFALAPNNLTDAPAECMEFMRGVPTEWDETRILAGYPGQYVVMARRAGDKWYVAGINATGKQLKINVDLPFTKGAAIDIYHSGKADENGRAKTHLTKLKMGKSTGRLSIAPNSGIVMVNK